MSLPRDRSIEFVKQKVQSMSRRYRLLICKPSRIWEHHCKSSSLSHNEIIFMLTIVGVKWDLSRLLILLLFELVLNVSTIEQACRADRTRLTESIIDLFILHANNRSSSLTNKSSSFFSNKKKNFAWRSWRSEKLDKSWRVYFPTSSISISLVFSFSSCFLTDQKDSWQFISPLFLPIKKVSS